MGKILVCGLVNIETTVRVEGFPIAYDPVRYPFFGIRSGVSGVGYNIARALTTLGSEVSLLSFVGTDLAGGSVVSTLAEQGIDVDYVLPQIRQTAQSVILYDGEGKRQIHTDLKDLQERVYPPDLFAKALDWCDLAVLTNINFSRPFLARAREAGKLIATDVHVISDADDPYNADFMRHANILFMSDEGLPCPPEEWALMLVQKYGIEIVVVGLGAQGALLSVKSDGFVGRVPAVHTRDIVSTIGAGDALFSSFVHFYSASKDPYTALSKAVVFVSYKIGTAGAGDGFLTEPEVDALCSC
jgi:sugar/nucleoside kinase (ribokinase family)